MTAADADADACEAALRRLLAWQLPIDLLAAILELPVETVTAMTAGRYPALDGAQSERLALFGATIVRAEIRCGHDPVTMARLLRTPLAALDGLTPLEAMRDGTAGLRRVHRAVGEAELPAERWWRVAPRR